MSSLYNNFFYQPLFNLLIFLYKTVALEDLGLAIILLTILIRTILYPLFQRSVRHQAVMQRLQPHIKKIQEEHKQDKEAQGRAMLDLYRTHKINPLSGFLLLLVQLPILIALFHIFRDILKPEALTSLYSFVSPPAHINTLFLGFSLIPLEKASIVVAVIAALAQYYQARLALPKSGSNTKDLAPAERIGRQMVFLTPVLTLIFLVNLPAAIGFYWITTSLFSILQQWIVNRELASKKENNDRLEGIR